MNVEHATYEYTSNNWNHQNSNKGFKNIWKPCQENI